MIQEVYSAILDHNRLGTPCVLVTVVESQGHSPSKPGSKMLLCSDRTLLGTVGGGALEKLAAEQAGEQFRKQDSALQQYWLDDGKNPSGTRPTEMVCGGSVTLFFEYIGTGRRIFLFGAGHIGKALVYHLLHLGFCIHVVDDREEFREALSGEYPRVSVYPDISAVKFSRDDYIVIATYSHELDYTILKSVLAADETPKYIGVVASRKKWAQFLKQLKTEVDAVPEDSIYAPCGLTIGKRDPHEIAVAITAEILSIANDVNGISNMKDKG